MLILVRRRVAGGAILLKSRVSRCAMDGFGAVALRNRNLPQAFWALVAMFWLVGSGGRNHAAEQGPGQGATAAGSSSVAGADWTRPRFSPVERLAPERLRAVRASRERWAAARVPVGELWGLGDFRAVIHVHAEDADPTRGTREQVLQAARSTGVQVVLLTDHRGPRAEAWRGWQDGVLFGVGAEESDGRLRFPGPAEKDGAGGGAVSQRATNDLEFLCQVENRLEAGLKGLVGMEIVNRQMDQVLDGRLGEYWRSAVSEPARWRELTNSLAQWPDELFAAGCDYRTNIMAKWDRELRRGRVVGIGANDVHRNVLVGGVTFDRYEVSFRHLTTHLLMREATEKTVHEALRRGHAYVAHDWMADPSGFMFAAVNNLGVFPMGDTALMQGTTRVTGLTPVPARQRLIHEGRVVAETNGTNLTFVARKPGAYRLEAWLEMGGEWRPWIYSNPVYLEEQSLFNLPLPNALPSPGVAVRRDIPYVTEPGKAHAKQHLDLYIPAGVVTNGGASGAGGAAGAPVFLFVHGGAWRTGDRNLYGPVGQRFARDGILTVVPSYRLAPKHPWPAQVEDTASALAWLVRHVAAHGGDTNRIYIGGHSAGGHLTSLLAFGERYLTPHGLTPAWIRGVVSLSGVYDLDIGDAMASVFGRQRDIRQEASPIRFVQKPGPRFFVSYCEWDYPLLAGQARRFAGTLRNAGLEAELFFTPKDNHIYEMISLTQDDDETAQAVSRFIRSGR